MTDGMFGGFAQPDQNWSQLPHEFIEWMPAIETLAEMKVIIYILRHTWGFNEFDKPKRITLDEFEHGRKYKDGSRMDTGVGMSRPSIIDGLARAVKHGFVDVEVDEQDAARVKKSYMIVMCTDAAGAVGTEEAGVKELDTRGKETLPQESNNFTPDEAPEVKELYTRGKEIEPRSEKETIETNTEEKDSAASAAAAVAGPADPPTPTTTDVIIANINLTQSSVAAILDALQDQPEPIWRQVLFAEEHQAPKGSPRKTLVKAIQDALNPQRKLQAGEEIELALELAQVVAERAYGWTKPVVGSTKARIMGDIKAVLLDLEEAGEAAPTADELRSAYAANATSGANAPRAAAPMLGMLFEFRNGKGQSHDKTRSTTHSAGSRVHTRAHSRVGTASWDQSVDREDGITVRVGR